MYDKVKPDLEKQLDKMVKTMDYCDPGSEDMRSLLGNIAIVLDIEAKNKPQHKAVLLLTSPAFMGFIQGIAQVGLLIAFETTGGIVTSFGRNLIKK